MKEPKKMIKTNEEVFPNEEEIEEAGAESHGFKVKKGPRMMTPEEVRQEGPVQKPYRNETVVRSQPIPKPVEPRKPIEPDEEGYPEHQSFSLKPVQKRAVWPEGTYEVKIAKAWQTVEDDRYNNDPNTGEPLKALFDNFLFATDEGATLPARTSTSRHQLSVLTGLLTAIFGDNPPMDIGSDDLVGRHLQIVVKTKVSKATGNEYSSVADFLKSTRQFETADQ